MEINPAEMRSSELYQHMIQLVTPRPIAWVSTVSEEGVANLAPFSYFNAVGSTPPTLMFCPGNARDGGPKHTLANIQRTGQFVVNVVSFDQAEAMNQSSASYGEEVSELEACGLTAAPSLRVKPPRVAEARAHFECELHSSIQLGVGPGGTNLVIGRILAIHIDDEVLDTDGRADPAKLDTVGRMGGIGFCRTNERFDLERPSIDND